MNKILIAIPTNRIKDYCLPEIIAALKTLSYPDFDILFCDNSQGHDYRHKINKLGYKCIHIAPSGKDVFDVLADSHEALRLECLKGDYTHMLHLESDILVKPDTLTRLVDAGLPIIGCPYFINDGNGDVKLMLQKAEEHKSSQMEVTYLPGKDIMWLTGKNERFFHIGLGCILIQRDVLEQFKFRYDKNVNMAPDTFFAQDMFYKQIPIYADTGCVLRHLQKNKWKTV